MHARIHGDCQFRSLNGNQADTVEPVINEREVAA